MTNIIEQVARVLKPSAWDCFDKVESGEYHAAPGYQDIVRDVNQSKNDTKTVLQTLADNPDVGAINKIGNKEIMFHSKVKDIIQAYLNHIKGE